MKRVYVMLLLVAIANSVVYAHDGGEGVENPLASVLNGLGTTKATLGIAALASLLITGSFWFMLRWYDKDFRGYDYGIIALTTATAVIHLVVGLFGEWLLLANGVGYFFFLALRYLPVALFESFRKFFTPVMLLYTVVTIVGYFLTHSHIDNLGLATKVIEVLLALTLSLNAMSVSLPRIRRTTTEAR